MICGGDASQTEIPGPGVDVLIYVLERSKEHIPKGRGMLTIVTPDFSKQTFVYLSVLERRVAP